MLAKVRIPIGATLKDLSFTSSKDFLVKDTFTSLDYKNFR